MVDFTINYNEILRANFERDLAAFKKLNLEADDDVYALYLYRQYVNLAKDLRAALKGELVEFDESYDYVEDVWDDYETAKAKFIEENPDATDADFGFKWYSFLKLLQRQISSMAGYLRF